MKIRRVVTGHSADGKSVVASDEALDPMTIALMPGLDLYQFWGGDSVPSLPVDGAPGKLPTYFPPAGGFRFALATIPPDSVTPAAPLDMEAAVHEAQQKVPDLLELMEPDHPGMHTTDTVDFEYIVSGEVWLELDDGVEVHLRAGDTVVQNGTRHAWHNRSAEPCRMISILIGARRQR